MRSSACCSVLRSAIASFIWPRPGPGSAQRRWAGRNRGAGRDRRDRSRPLLVTVGVDVQAAGDREHPGRGRALAASNWPALRHTTTIASCISSSATAASPPSFIRYALMRGVVAEQVGKGHDRRRRRSPPAGRRATCAVSARPESGLPEIGLIRRVHRPRTSQDRQGRGRPRRAAGAQGASILGYPLRRAAENGSPAGKRILVLPTNAGIVRIRLKQSRPASWSHAALPASANSRSVGDIVIGSGIAGLSAAWLLAARNRVTFEKSRIWAGGLSPHGGGRWRG